MSNTPTTVCDCKADLELLTCRNVSAMLKIHPGSVWRLAALAEANLPCGGFPRPLRLAAKTIRWRAADVAAYLDALAGWREATE